MSGLEDTMLRAAAELETAQRRIVRLQTVVLDMLALTLKHDGKFVPLDQLHATVAPVFEEEVRCGNC